MSIPRQQSDAPSDRAPSPAPASRARARRRSKQRRRLANVAGLMVALVLTGAGYSLFSPARAAGDTTGAQSRLATVGKGIYDRSCITCHGDNLQGVSGRGPSLIGVGAAAVYFQVHTGRMPLVMQDADAANKPRVISERPRTDLNGKSDLDALMAFVESNGGGPTVPGGDLRGGDLAQGGELFRLNCASCHNFVGEGGALSSGKSAPSLQNADDKTIYAAMLSGPENMPVFGDNQLTPSQKRSIIDYVQTIKTMSDPGGAGIGRIGPVPEGLVIWVVGIGALLFGVFWMGSKA